MATERKAVLVPGLHRPALYLPLLHVGGLRLFHVECDTSTTANRHSDLYHLLYTILDDQSIDAPVACIVSGRLGFSVRSVLDNFAFSDPSPCFTFALTSLHLQGHPNRRLEIVVLESYFWFVVLAFAAFLVYRQR